MAGPQAKAFAPCELYGLQRSGGSSFRPEPGFCTRVTLHLICVVTHARSGSSTRRSRCTRNRWFLVGMGAVWLRLCSILGRTHCIRRGSFRPSGALFCVCCVGCAGHPPFLDEVALVPQFKLHGLPRSGRFPAGTPPDVRGASTCQRSPHCRHSTLNGG